MKYCPKCGRELDDEMSSCPYCVHDQVDGSVEAEPNEAEIAPAADLENTAPELNIDVPARKIDIKKIAVTAASLLLVVGLIIACVLIFKPDPNDVVNDAYNKTADRLDDVFAKSEGFEAMSSVLADIVSADRLSMQLTLRGDQLELSADGSEVNIDLDMTVNVDLENEVAAGSLDMTLANDNFVDELQYDQLKLLYSVDPDALMFKLSDYSDMTYGVAIDENIFDRIIASYIYRNTSLCQMYPAVALRMMSAEIKNSGALTGDNAYDTTDELRDSYDKLTATFEYAESNKNIPMLGDLEIYGIKYDEDCMADFAELLFDTIESSGTDSFGDDLNDFTESVVDALGDGSIELYLGINDDGCLSAFSVYTGSEYYSIVLEGKENLWESIGFYYDDALLLSGGFKQTKSGFQLRMGTVSVSYNDKAGKLTLKIASSTFGEIAIPFYFDVLDDGKGVSFKLDLSDFGLVVSYSVCELEDEVKSLDTSFTDILEFDKAEFEKFMLLFADDAFGTSLLPALDDSFEYENVFDDPDIDYYD